MNNHHVLLPLLFATALIGCGGSDGKPKPPKINTAPVATAASFTTQADTELSGMLEGMDADRDSLTFAAAEQPSVGTLTLTANGGFTYLPNATVTGMDQFTFTVSDGKATSMTATVNITIDALQVSFDDYSRAAFEQSATDEPLPVNGREFEQDVTEPTAYDDLLE